MGDRTLDYIALGVLSLIVLTFIYVIIYIHDIPYDIAKKRNHPHQDAIHTAGWVSLFLMHTIWPFLWIWATLYKPEAGWGFSHKPANSPAPVTTSADAEQLRILTSRIAELEDRENLERSDQAQQLHNLQARITQLEHKQLESREV